MGLGQDRTMIMLCLVISSLVAVNLTVTILSITGSFLPKAAQISLNNMQLLHNILDRDQALDNGTIKNKSFNLTEDSNSLLHKLVNQSISNR